MQSLIDKMTLEKPVDYWNVLNVSYDAQNEIVSVTLGNDGVGLEPMVMQVKLGQKFWIEQWEKKDRKIITQ